MRSKCLEKKCEKKLMVFSDMFSDLNGSLNPLHNKYVDTGMGFERLVAVLQGKSSNYDTDLFTPIFNGMQKVNMHMRTSHIER